tara:strand:- start:16 stop:465 length:450 start_codon:yes stop_codon:yes gene_type:complete
LSLEYIVSNEIQLISVARRISSYISKDQIIFFEGEVGSGKTTLIRYLLNEVSRTEKKTFFFQGSPTYQREHIYNFNKFSIIHFDFYQVQNNKLDLDEYFNNNCIFVEWPLENLIKRYSHMALFVKILVVGKKRHIKIKSSNKKWLHKIR